MWNLSFSELPHNLDVIGLAISLWPARHGNRPGNSYGLISQRDGAGRHHPAHHKYLIGFRERNDIARTNQWVRSFSSFECLRQRVESQTLDHLVATFFSRILFADIRAAGVHHLDCAARILRWASGKAQ